MVLCFVPDLEGHVKSVEAVAKTPIRRHSASRGTHCDIFHIPPGTEVSYLQESTPERVKAAVKSLKRCIPPAGKKSVVRMREELWP